jgi:alpha-tubulin suppressor-like RCC1 family protein
MFAGNTGLTTGVARIAAGADFNCADMYGSFVQCFGNNYSGQLGSGVGGFSAAPVTVSGATGLHGVVTGTQHACALDANNAVWCWGDNAFGQIGNGEVSRSLVPVTAKLR